MIIKVYSYNKTKFFPQRISFTAVLSQVLAIAVLELLYKVIISYQGKDTNNPL